MPSPKINKKICKVCGSEYMVRKNNISRSKFCGRACTYKSQIGREVSLETRIKASESKMGESNPMWKGNNVGYTALHDWVRRRLPKPEVCELCHATEPYDLANRSGEYKRDLSDWEWLCRACHMKEDGRIFNLKQYQGNTNEDGDRTTKDYADGEAVEE